MLELAFARDASRNFKERWVSSVSVREIAERVGMVQLDMGEGSAHS